MTLGLLALLVSASPRHLLDKRSQRREGRMDKVEMKQKVKDDITGFSGTVTAIATYLDGTTSCLVQSEMTDPSKYPEHSWIDAKRLSVVK